MVRLGPLEMNVTWPGMKTEGKVLTYLDWPNEIGRRRDELLKAAVRDLN
jgi:hypothetical protein